MNDTDFAQPQSFEEALEIINQSPTLRKIKSYIDQSSLSADMKAILYDVAKFSVKIGETVIAIGRRILEIAIALVKKFPNTAIGALVGVVIATILGGTLGAITIAGAAPFAGLAAFLSKIAVLLGAGKGFIDDLRNNAAKNEMERIAAQFDILGMGLAKA